MVWIAAVPAAGVALSVLIRALLDVIAPMDGYLHPSNVALWHNWIAVIVSLSTLTGVGLLQLWRGQLGGRWRALLVVLVSLLVWPLALLASVGLGSRLGAPGFLFGFLATLVIAAPLIWWLARYGRPMALLSGLAAVAVGILLGLCVLVVEIFPWYSVSAVYI